LKEANEYETDVSAVHLVELHHIIGRISNIRASLESDSKVAKPPFDMYIMSFEPELLGFWSSLPANLQQNSMKSLA
jgi:hypothetical protein